MTQYRPQLLALTPTNASRVMKTYTIKKDLLPSEVRTELVKLPSQVLINVTTSVENGDFDPSKGLEQFSPAERKAISVALETGDRSALTPPLNAYIDYQVAKSKAGILESQSSAEAALQQQAAEQVAIQNAELAALEERKKKKERQQLVINLTAIVLGAGTIYYLARR